MNNRERKTILPTKNYAPIPKNVKWVRGGRDVKDPVPLFLDFWIFENRNSYKTIADID